MGTPVWKGLGWWDVVNISHKDLTKKILVGVWEKATMKGVGQESNFVVRQKVEA